MYKLEIVFLFLLITSLSYGQEENRVGDFNQFSDSITSSLPWAYYGKTVIKLKSDTVFITSIAYKKPGDTPSSYAISSLPLHNIRKISTRVNNDKSYEVFFEAMSDRRGFSVFLPSESRSYAIPFLSFHTNIKDSVFFRNVANTLTPYLSEYEPDCSFIDKEYVLRDSFIEGIQDYKLVEKSTVNSNEQKDSILVDLFKKNLPELASKPRFRFMYITLLISPGDTISHFYLGNYEMYLYEKDNYPALKIDDNGHAHSEPRGGYITEPEKIMIESLFRAQKWGAGLCGGNKVNTICVLNLNL